MLNQCFQTSDLPNSAARCNEVDPCMLHNEYTDLSHTCNRKK